VNPTDTNASARDAAASAAQRLGQRLRRARLARNLTQGEVAKNQFSVSYVSAVERGQIRPSLGALEKLAERLHVPLTDLLNDAHSDLSFSTLSTKRRETGSDRWREEVEARLYEAQKGIGDGRPESVVEAIETLTRLSNRQLTPRETALVHLYLSQAHLLLTHGDEARDEAQRGLVSAERAGDLALAERIRFQLGLAYSTLYSHSLAADSFRRVLQAFDENVLRDPMLKVSTLSRLAEEDSQLGAYDEALKYVRLAAETVPQASDPRTLAEAYSAIGQTYSARGDTASARYYLIRSIAAFDEAKNRREVAAVHGQYGRALAQAGEIDHAFAELRLALDAATAQQDATGVAEGQRAMAQLFLQVDRLDEARAAAEESLKQAEVLKDNVQRAQALVTLALVLERQQQIRPAESRFEEAIESLRSSGVGASAVLASTYEAYSGFLENQGEAARALEMLKNARGMPVGLARGGVQSAPMRHEANTK